MDDVLDDLIRLARRAKRAAQPFQEDSVSGAITRMGDAADDVGRAWCGLFLGYQSTVYKSDLQPVRPGEHFDEDGYETVGAWSEFTYETILAEISERAGNPETEALVELANKTNDTFDEIRGEVLPVLDALLEEKEEKPLREVRDKIAKLPRKKAASDYVRARMPSQFLTSDIRAMQTGIKAPHHMSVAGWIEQLESCGRQVEELGKLCSYAARYIEQRRSLKGRSVAKRTGKIFIGHGRSPAWKELKEFIVDRLRLEYEEYNREPTAGLSRKERLLEMLESSRFAFLVFTAEDLHEDEKFHPRENVIHEAGLFQGRYGFERAIILLEEGCAEFSNIHGIDQIRFSKGNLLAASEEIRRVLEREEVL